MNSIPESDKKLIADLQDLVGKVENLKRGLYTRRAGCTCDEKHLCALHAAVWDHLDEASNNLARVIGQAQAEG